MICLTDNDIIKKLAICDLLDEAIAAWGVSHQEILVLPTAEFTLGVAKKPEKTRRKLGDATFDRLEAFLRKVRKIEYEPAPHETLLFENAFDIDPGEAILFSATAHYAEFLLATGDKRCLRALYNLAGAEALIARMAKRVICFEQIILRVIDFSGFEAVRTKVVPVCDCDMVLGVAFGSGHLATEQSVTESLRRYVFALRQETGALLIAD